MTYELTSTHISDSKSNKVLLLTRASNKEGGGGVPHFLTNTFTYLFLILYKDRIVKRKTVSRMLFAAELLTD